MVLGRAALVVTAVPGPRGNVDHLAGFSLMITVPSRTARSFKDYPDQVHLGPIADGGCPPLLESS